MLAVCVYVCLRGVALYLSTLNLGKWMEFLMNTVKLMASTKAGSLEKTPKLIRIVVQPVPGKYKQAYYVIPGILWNLSKSLHEHWGLQLSVCSYLIKCCFVFFYFFTLSVIFLKRLKIERWRQKLDHKLIKKKKSLCDLPDCGVLLNRTPSLNLTGFESVIVVLNTFARPSTCNTRFRANFEMSMNKPWEHMKYVDIGKNLWRIKHYHGRQNQPLPGRSQNLLCSWHWAR